MGGGGGGLSSLCSDCVCLSSVPLSEVAMIASSLAHL